jgi:hypothetical protein
VASRRIHQEFPVQVDAAGRPYHTAPREACGIPRMDGCLISGPADAGSKLSDDFRGLCSALDMTWKGLCDLSEELSEN